MRVALVIQKLGGLRGGAERVVIELAEALSERGHEVTIATYEPGIDDPGYVASGVTYVDLFPRPLRAVLRLLVSSGRMDATETAVSTTGNAGVVAQRREVCDVHFVRLLMPAMQPSTWPTDAYLFD